MDHYFFRPDEREKRLPASIAPWADARQRIGFIRLRLEPPIRIQSYQDIVFIFVNHNFLRVIVAVIWMIVCGIIESFLAQLSEMRYSRTEYDKYTLTDLLHDAFPRVENYQIVNYLLVTTLVYTFIVFTIQLPDWTTRWIVLRRWLVIMGFLYIFRGVCLVVTTLPASRMDNCIPPDIALNGTAGARFGFMFLQITGQLSPCTDNIFSGHTATMMSCVMVWRIHSRLRRIYSWIAYTIVFVALLMILFTRFHYTVDVILAIYITYTAWYIYMDTILEASKQVAFAFSGPSTLNLFRSQLNSFDGEAMYEYLTWQPSPLLPTWIMWLCVYADGLDIRLRTLRIMDEYGELAREHDQEGQQKLPPIVISTATHSTTPKMVDVHEMTFQSLPI
ncbi:PAP2 superfamily C-terminal-domain-containing protein [Phascolomyces articulosus]|uniref:PAP2 superfamily C-terminal-domain-containing protein n=1 Tax=Phascolomyces articulosus TaxID=60185 RepID=A0AAD5PKM8_9FUNG|nr:PAP2 superfamily C-terminal-domain-containing protein [Phascolomyces articulosus]